MNLIQQCKAMVKPNLAPWSRMTVAGGNGIWSEEKQAWYLISGSTNNDKYSMNYTNSGNWVKLKPGKYRMTANIWASSNNVRVLVFLGKTADVFNFVQNLYWPNMCHYDFTITEDMPWYCMRFGTSEYNQTVYLKWCKLERID